MPCQVCCTIEMAKGIMHNDNICLIKKCMFDALKLSQNTSQFTIGAIQNELRSIVILHAVSNQSHLLTKTRTKVTMGWGSTLAN